MSLKFLKFCRRTLVICLETAAVIFGFVVLMGGLITWQLSSNGLNLTFAKDYIQASLNEYAPEYDIDVEGVRLVWPEINGPLALSLSKASLSQNENKVFEVDSMQVGLYSGSLFLGNIRPVYLNLLNPSLKLSRTEDGAIELGTDGDKSKSDEGQSVHEQDVSLEMNSFFDDGYLEAVLEDFISETDNKDAAFPILNQIDFIRIQDARLKVEDKKLKQQFTVYPLFLSLEKQQGGFTAEMNINGVDVLDQQTKISLTAFYSLQDKDFDLALDVKNLNPVVVLDPKGQRGNLQKNRLYLSLTANATVDLNGVLKSTDFSIVSEKADLWLEGLYDRYLFASDVNINGIYDPDKRLLSFQDTHLTVEQVKTHINAQIPLDAITGQEGDYDIPLSVMIPKLHQAEVKPLWPSLLDEEGAKIWATENLSNGYLENIKIDLNTNLIYSAIDKIPSDGGASSDNDGQGNESQKQSEQELSSEFSIQTIDASFDVHDMSVDYRAPLAKVHNAFGSGTYSTSTDSINIVVDSGTIEGLDIKKAEIELTNIMAGDGYATISTLLDGPMPNVFKYIEKEPIALDSESLGLDTKNVKGNANFTVDVGFPTIRDVKAEEVKVKVAGTLSDVVFPKIVQGMDITGGPFRFSAADMTLTLSGSGFFDSRPIMFEYSQFLESDGQPYSSKVNASFVSDPVLRDKLGMDLSDFVHGSVPVNIAFTRYNDNKAEIVFDADLQRSTVHLDVFDYNKPTQEPGTAEGSIVLSGEYIQEVRDLDIKTNDLLISDARIIFRQGPEGSEMSQGSFPVFKLNENDLSINFEISSDDAIQAQLQGAFFDARPFLNPDKKDSKKAEDKQALLVSLNADRMRTHAARIIQNVQLYLDLDTQSEIRQLELDAMAGKGEIYLRMKPNDEGLMTLRLESDDAGAMLKAFDIYETMQDGKLALYGESKSIETNSTIHGNLQVTDFRIKNAPILARILSLAGPAAIPNMLSGDGMKFSRLETEFQWDLLDGGDIYKVDEGKASAASLRLTFNGTIDKSQDRWDVSGTIVPLSAINSMIGNIPLVGDILAGGKDGAILAATYTVKGKGDSPKVSVNPLSALAPGILRKLIFEDEKSR